MHFSSIHEIYAVCEFGGHLDLEYQYIYANGLLLARYDKASPDTHYYHHDGLGSIIGLTDGGMFSPVEQSYFYDEFGNELGSWGSVSNHYLYTGQEYDGSISSLYNLRARLYDMRIGRFLVEDPILQSGNYWICSDMCEYERYVFRRNEALLIPMISLSPDKINAYGYCVNNPIKYVDPLGLGEERCKLNRQCYIECLKYWVWDWADQYMPALVYFDPPLYNYIGSVAPWFFYGAFIGEALAIQFAISWCYHYCQECYKTGEPWPIPNLPGATTGDPRTFPF